MNSFLFQLGFDPIYLIIILGILSISSFSLVIILLIKYNKLWIRYDIFMRGKDAESLEEKINKIAFDLETINHKVDYNGDIVSHLVKDEKSAYKKIGITRYNAFPDVGGKLSFSLCLLDAYDSGFLITVMHASEGCYTYMKEVMEGESYINLSKEEEKALEDAKNCDKS